LKWSIKAVAANPSSPLLTFCQDFVASDAEGWPPQEDTLARAFVSHFPVASILFEPGIKEFCSSLGLDVSFRELPPDLAGSNFEYGEKREIVLSEIEDPFGITTHTLFHEIREIIERVFTGLGRPTISPAEMEQRAEQFAVAVRMHSTFKESEFLLTGALEIRSDLLRWGSVVLIFAFIFVQVIGHTLLPKFEAIMKEH
jgi:hypothetical protein